MKPFDKEIVAAIPGSRAFATCGPDVRVRQLADLMFV
jgi:hypothetical protein